MSVSTATINVVFLIFIAAIAFLPIKVLGMIALGLIFLFPLFAAAFAAYFASINASSLWSTDPTSSYQTKYNRAVVRSSIFYIAISLFAIILPLKRGSLLYKYFSLYVIMIAAYVYDRAISLDDGLNITVNNPLEGIKLSFMSICSPSFIRFFFVLMIEISLTLLVNMIFAPLIPNRFRLIRHIFTIFIVPFLIFSIVTAPLRMRWAYPNVVATDRFSYINAYLIAFILVGLLTYITKSKLFLISILILLAALLQFGAVSNAPDDYSLKGEVSFSTPVGVLLALVTLIAVIVHGWSQFKDNIFRLLIIKSTDIGKETSSGKSNNVRPMELH